MRILWHSSAPNCHSGYGVATRNLIRRLRADGHFVRVATKHMYPGWENLIDRQAVAEHVVEAKRRLKESGKVADRQAAINELNEAYKELEGVEVFEGTNVRILNDMMRDEGFDWHFSMFDIWVMAKNTLPAKHHWIAYVPVDTEWISDALTSMVDETGYQVAMSKHGERELRSKGFTPFYAPLGVETDVFKPDVEGRQRFRKDFGWTDEHFVIGSVGLNYGDDRKGFIPLMRAFKKFSTSHPEARLYIHTHIKGSYPGTLPYLRVAQRLGIMDKLAVPHQGFNDTNRIDEAWMNDVYNGMDVFCLNSRGEGFGMPALEAQSAGIPAIMTATTTGPELVGGHGWLINVTDNDLRYLPNGTWRHEPGEGAVLDCLESAYNVWKLGNWQVMKDKAREFAMQYDWDVLWEKNWKPMFDVFAGLTELRKA